MVDWVFQVLGPTEKLKSGLVFFNKIKDIFK